MHTTEVEVGVTVTITVEEGVAAGTAEGERCRTGLLGSGRAGSDRIESRNRVRWDAVRSVRCGAVRSKVTRK